MFMSMSSNVLRHCRKICKIGRGFIYSFTLTLVLFCVTFFSLLSLFCFFSAFSQRYYLSILVHFVVGSTTDLESLTCFQKQNRNFCYGLKQWMFVIERENKEIIRSSSFFGLFFCLTQWVYVRYNHATKLIISSFPTSVSV